MVTPFAACIFVVIDGCTALACTITGTLFGLTVLVRDWASETTTKSARACADRFGENVMTDSQGLTRWSQVVGAVVLDLDVDEDVGRAHGRSRIGRPGRRLAIMSFEGTIDSDSQIGLPSWIRTLAAIVSLLGAPLRSRLVGRAPIALAARPGIGSVAGTRVRSRGNHSGVPWPGNIGPWSYANRGRRGG
jgi:hypothetical protein